MCVCAAMFSYCTPRLRPSPRWALPAMDAAYAVPWSCARWVRCGTPNGAGRVPNCAGRNGNIAMCADWPHPPPRRGRGISASAKPWRCAGSQPVRAVTVMYRWRIPSRNRPEQRDCGRENKKAARLWNCAAFNVVPRAGLEPAHLAAGDFESPVSTNFTTWAGVL